MRDVLGEEHRRTGRQGQVLQGRNLVQLPVGIGMGQVALVASGDQAEGPVSGIGVVQRNQAGHQQATELPLGAAAVTRVSPRVGLSALSQAAAAPHSSNPCPGSNQAKLSSPDECL